MFWKFFCCKIAGLEVGAVVNDSPDPADKLEELFVFPDTHTIQIKTSFSTVCLYVMKDGRIVKQVMCGDSEVQEKDYEVYSADEKHLMTKQRLTDLLKKYENTI
ncbi:MAG: hypothetical protein KBS52_03080 [Clostridiales bacterium]|nr:hypothetical protein [Candidatus Equinaster intestinalis]